jgi:hypothetical protein
MQWILRQCQQLKTAIKTVLEHYPDEGYVFIFDNAKTHMKCAEGSLSALKMPKGPSTNFGVEVNIVKDEKVEYLPDGKILKTKIPMSNGKLPNGNEQAFYFPGDREGLHAGWP